MSEIKQEILDLLILNGRKPQSIKSGERVVYLYDALNIVNKEFSKTEQPQLNDNQQIVFDWLRNKYTGDADPFGTAACLFSQTPRSEVIVATLKLTRDEQAQVLKIFANWALEQEEE